MVPDLTPSGFISTIATLNDINIYLQTVEFAKQYYGCNDIEGVYLENEGGFGTVRLDT